MFDETKTEYHRPLQFFIFEKSEFLRDISSWLLSNSKWILIYIVVLVVTLILSNLFYWGIIQWILDIVTSTLLLALFGIFLLLIVEKPAPIEIKITSDYGGKKKRSVQKYTKKFKWSIAWTTFVAIGIIVGGYFLQEHRKHYHFMRNTFYFEYSKDMVHIFDNCREITDETEEIKGYEIYSNSDMCSACEELAEEYNSGYEGRRFYRK